MLGCSSPESLAADAQSEASRDRAESRTTIPYYNAAPRSAAFVRRAVRAWNRAAIGTTGSLPDDPGPEDSNGPSGGPAGWAALVLLVGVIGTVLRATFRR